jgi:hypothetical protein
MTFPFTKAIDRQVDAQFQKDPSGRLVFLPSGGKGKAYFVDSKSDEEKVRAFVKMYRGAGVLISWVQQLCFLAWIVSFTTGAHKWTTEAGIASFFIFVLLLAVWVLWLLYKQTVPTFTSSLSEVGPDLRDQLTDVCPPPQRLRVLALGSLFAAVVILALGIVSATRWAPPKAPCPPKLSSTTTGSQ